MTSSNDLIKILPTWLSMLIYLILIKLIKKVKVIEFQDNID